MNSKRERLDNVVSNFYLAKKSKLRQFEICKSRKKVCVPDENKIEDSLSSKIVTEKWRKRKQHKGPGYFQKNRKIDSDNRKYEAWEKVPIIPWEGEHFLSSGEKINMYHTCTIDNFLQILLVFYSLNIEQMQNLVSSVDPLFTTLCEVIQLLLTSDFYGAKYHWLTKLCDLSPTSGNKILNSFGTDKQLIMYPLRNIFCRSYQFASCSSEYCPSDRSMQTIVLVM